MSLENSDTDDYINIEDLIEEKEKLHQIQINDDELIIKTIGYCNHPPDLIIKENFGRNNNLSIYNCTLTENELNIESLISEHELFYPIIKLTEKIDNYVNTYSIAIKILEKIKYDQKIILFENYFIYKKEKKLIYKILEKNINSNNIIEILLDNYCIYLSKE